MQYSYSTFFVPIVASVLDKVNKVFDSARPKNSKIPLSHRQIAAEIVGRKKNWEPFSTRQAVFEYSSDFS